jgi:hypothetical protein
LFAFAILATGGMWVYWKLHRAPFLPLERALVEEFPGSSPHVEGGQRKMHEKTPRILRVTLKIDFDPLADEAKAREFAEKVAAFLREHHDASRYQKLEIRLYFPEPEREIKQWSVELPPAPSQGP